MGLVSLGLVSLRNAQAVPGWVHYQPRLQCPLLRYLPHFLATFLVENLAEALNIPEPPAIQPRQSFYTDNTGRKWSMATLNQVLNDVLMCHPDGTQIAVVGCAEWESEYFKGVSKLHVRTLDKFYGRNRRVSTHSSTCFILFHTVSYCFILFHTVSYCFQECFATIPPLPYRDMDIDPDKFNILEDMDQVMFGRPELIFKVTLKRYIVAADHSIITSEEDALEIPLIFFSAFERVILDDSDSLHRMGEIILLYEPGPLPALEPIMHVGFLSHVLCRVPLVPCYMDGNEHPTIPRRFYRSSRVQHGRADRHESSGDGSRLYEVNMWMWKFGRGMPRSRTVAETERLRASFAIAKRVLQQKTRKRNRNFE
jgi:hypothetical protein